MFSSQQISYTAKYSIHISILKLTYDFVNSNFQAIKILVNNKNIKIKIERDRNGLKAGKLFNNFLKNRAMMISRLQESLRFVSNYTPSPQV